MDYHLMKRFQVERARRLEEVAQKLLEQNDVDAAKKYLEWADTSTKLLAAEQQAARRKWTVFLIVVCVVLIGLAWTLRISFTHLACDVTTGHVNLTLRKDWTGEQRIAAEDVLLANITEVSAPGLNLAVASDQGLGRMALHGPGITLTRLSLTAGAQIELTAREDELHWVVKNASLSGTLQVQDAALSVNTGHDDRTIAITAKNPPEKIQFKAEQTTAMPVELHFVIRSPWKLRNLQVRALDFLEERQSGEGEFQSVIDSGTITLRENGFTQKLEEADELILTNPQSQQLELVKADDGVQVLFEGSAERIQFGSQDFRQNLTPTYFEYLARQKWLTMFWGAVIFLSGLFWKIRDTVFS
jgi:hypothetical protein